MLGHFPSQFLPKRIMILLSQTQTLASLDSSVINTIVGQSSERFNGVTKICGLAYQYAIGRPVYIIAQQSNMVDQIVFVDASRTIGAAVKRVTSSTTM